MTGVATIRHATVVGVGLLGGSAALALRAANPSVQIAGVGRRKASLDEAVRLGAIDTAHFDAAEAARRSDLVVLATPVAAFEAHLRALRPALRDGAIVTDVGSTKARVVRLGERLLGAGGPFVGSHPMAGSERKGVAFARADLFTGATCVVTPTRHTPQDLTEHVEALWAALGMRTVRMSPDAHDRAVARVSHLPHVLAALLMMLPQKADLDVAATGFRDATRLAGGDPEMWRDILTTNRKAILDAMDRFSGDIAELRTLIEADDTDAIERFFDRAKRRRDETIARTIPERRVAME